MSRYHHRHGGDPGVRGLEGRAGGSGKALAARGPRPFSFIDIACVILSIGTSIGNTGPSEQVEGVGDHGRGMLRVYRTADFLCKNPRTRENNWGRREVLTIRWEDVLGPETKLLRARGDQLASGSAASPDHTGPHRLPLSLGTIPYNNTPFIFPNCGYGIKALPRRLPRSSPLRQVLGVSAPLVTPRHRRR